MFGNIVATVIGLIVVAISGTLVTLVNPLVGIPFLLCGIFLLLFPNFLSKKVMDDGTSPAGSGNGPAEVAVPRIETYRLSDVNAHLDALRDLGEKVPDYALSREEIMEKQIGGENLYEYRFPAADASLEDHGEEIHVLAGGQWIGNIGRNNRERVRRLLQEDRAEKLTVKVTGGPRRILSAEDGEIHEYPDDYNVRLEITVAAPDKDEKAD